MVDMEKSYDDLMIINLIIGSVVVVFTLLKKIDALTLPGLGLIKINTVSANFNNPRLSLILYN